MMTDSNIADTNRNFSRKIHQGPQDLAAADLKKIEELVNEIIEIYDKNGIKIVQVLCINQDLRELLWDAGVLKKELF